MKATALIAAAALAFGTAAFAQANEPQGLHGSDSQQADQQDHGQANDKMRNGFHRLGEKTRHALHRAGDKIRHVAHNDRHDANDTRAMGASRDTRDVESGRRQRMDDAYANWKAKNERSPGR